MTEARRKLNQGVLAKLGNEKLAELVLNEASRNPDFRRRVSAALAAIKGADAVSSIIDRRLRALERAHSFIDVAGSRSFAHDLCSTLATISDELGRIDPDAAVCRLVRFLGTARDVLSRVDDSNGHIQDVYYGAADAILTLAPTLSKAGKTTLLEWLHPVLTYADNDFCSHILRELLPMLPETSIHPWDEQLAEELRAIHGGKPKDDDWRHGTRVRILTGLRQIIADYRGDTDAFITLEQSRGQNIDALAIAERLLKTGRHAEALEWVRKPGIPQRRDFTRRNVAGGPEIGLSAIPERIRVELRILDAMGAHAEAQKLRWQFFLESVEGVMLREYIRRLPDFEEFEVLDRAFSHALTFHDTLRALQFFIFWPKLDLASRLVLANPAGWNGQQYYALLPVAEALEEPYPAAATVLYRALLDAILGQARFKAYGHAARYFERLHTLGDRLPPGSPLASHATYKAELLKRHGRKSGFWGYIDPGLR